MGGFLSFFVPPSWPRSPAHPPECSPHICVHYQQIRQQLTLHLSYGRRLLFNWQGDVGQVSARFGKALVGVKGFARRVSDGSRAFVFIYDGRVTGNLLLSQRASALSQGETL